jgi:protein phosphatase
MIPRARAHLHVAVQTHAGLSGKQNEDRFAVTAYQRGPQDATPVLCAVVADGIGGHRAGEIAAEIAVNTITHLVAISDGLRPLETLQYAVQAASQEISRQANDRERLGMGTTCACALVLGNRLYTASVGDSRIYLLRGDTLYRLTTDHTWVQEAIEKGILDAGSARRHPNYHVIRRYLGSAEPPQVDVRLRLKKDESDTQARLNQGMPLTSADIVLLCTDGLTDEVEDGEIARLLRPDGGQRDLAAHLEAAARRLVELACQRGGHDNITVILIAMPDRQGEKKRRENWFSRLLH